MQSAPMCIVTTLFFWLALLISPAAWFYVPLSGAAAWWFG